LRDVKGTPGRPPTRWSVFFVKTLNERYDALRVPQGSDGELCALSRSKLEGRALSQYEALLREIMEDGYDTLVNAMEKACQAEHFSEVLALEELKKFVKREEQSVVEFCVELERLTRRSSPELDEAVLAIFASSV
uniref:Retrotrans_gag domain-containing protein n=1 Tax=Heligmosomoides polygyrus TaxID=6339 RepID=A0A183F7U0_HELPZ